MSGRAAAVPNAWDDDDWVAQADKGPAAPAAAPALNRQERLQQHAEANRRLWESADSAETFHYIEATSGGAPLAAAPFRPQVKVLSRKPAASASAAPDDDPDARAARAGARLLSPEEIRAKQRRERDEKQRRYDEARAKIFGESAPSSRGSSPGAGAVTPPRSEARGAAAAASSSSARGRGRGNGTGNGNGYKAGGNHSGSGNTSTNTGGSYNSNNNNGNQNTGAHYFENRRPANPGPTRELYDPNSSPRPDSLGRGRGVASGDSSPRVQTPRADHPQQQQQQQQFQQHQAIRSPRGPDSSGRGGFGLARRGARET